MKTFTWACWAARIIAAAIMAQTLYFKFTGAEESVYIFSTVGMEPVGRIAVGILELVASVLLIINATAWLGALLGAGLMAGALGMHATLLGIEVKGDGGYLFCLALIVLICCCWVIFFNRQKINTILSRFRKSRV
ncbi:DoxX family membrane protein [Ohtaekwangia kribbensis]|jgi:putative oxidoreductase|uniref:DoxX family membrane protein n=1 Tax=Ohtaekwangia kribbensis TaxID=688913 RepID=A0ABW3JWR8_9BACT